MPPVGSKKSRMGSGQALPTCFDLTVRTRWHIVRLARGTISLNVRPIQMDPEAGRLFILIENASLTSGAIPRIRENLF